MKLPWRHSRKPSKAKTVFIDSCPPTGIDYLAGGHFIAKHFINAGSSLLLTFL
jgi:hypothetical protein